MTSKMVAHALGLLIVKDKTHGGMLFFCYSKLYDSLVQPVIDYEVVIWGTKDYSCIAAVQNRACHYLWVLESMFPM